MELKLDEKEIYCHLKKEFSNPHAQILELERIIGEINSLLLSLTSLKTKLEVELKNGTHK